DRVQIVSVPGSGLSVRLWDSGLRTPNECCLDFIDSETGKATNSLEDWMLLPANQTGVFDFVISSREEMFGYQKKDIPAGEERFDIQRGVSYAVRRPNHEDFLFEVPLNSTPGAAQPRDSRAA
ncbi:hypothetical protein BT96DRAFT_838291, partial [Gymnopus androsaceus JB14]